MFINEEDVMLEACIQMRLQTKLNNDWVMVTVDVGVYSIESFEELAN